MILNNATIKLLCENGSSIYEPFEITTPDRKPMIDPFVDHQVKTNDDGQPVVSYGLSYAGYDIRLNGEFRIFSKPNDGRIIDIKSKSHFDYDDKVSEVVTGDSIVIPPGGLVISSTLERFNIPNSVMGIALGKSTWARSGLIVNVTPLEPGWSGYLVVELTNGTNLPLKVYAYEGIAQIVFHVLNQPTGPYEGKYRDQVGVVGSRMSDNPDNHHYSERK